MTSCLPGGWDDSFDTQMDETISSRCGKIKNELTRLLELFENDEKTAISTSVTESDVRDRLDRFGLWAGNLGALQRPESKLSLDSRLAGSKDVRDFICEELSDMLKAVEDLQAIVTDSAPNRMIEQGLDHQDPDLQALEKDFGHLDDLSLDEAATLLQVINECLSSLFKIGILIRQPAQNSRDRFERAIRATKGMFSTTWDIDYVRNKYPKLGRADLSRRMGEAITKRRQFITYCRDHASRLAQVAVHDDRDDDNDDRGTHHDGDGESRVATSYIQSSKATTFVPREDIMQTLRENMETEFLDDGEDASSVTNCSISTTSEEMATLKLPRLAELSPDDEPFQCPICFTLQQFRSEKTWRRHAFKDLKAYLCTMGGDKECGRLLFEDRTSWFTHELEEHHCSYICLLCVDTTKPTSQTPAPAPGLAPAPSAATKEFEPPKKLSRKKLLKHIRNIHSNDFSEDQLSGLVEAGRQPAAIFNARDCPFCNEWSDRLRKRLKGLGQSLSEVEIVVSTKRYRRHVAMHLEQLAIWAVPQHHNDEDDNDEEGSVESDDSRSGGMRAVDDLKGGTMEEVEGDNDDDEKKKEEEEEKLNAAAEEEIERISKEKKMEELRKHMEATAKLKAEIEELERWEREEEERKKKEVSEEERQRKEEERLRDMLWYV